MEGVIKEFIIFMGDVNWLLAPDWISAVASVFLVYIAYKWKNQHRGKLEMDLAIKILRIVHRIQAHLSLFPTVYKGDERLDSYEFIREYPDEFVSLVKSLTNEKWPLVAPLVSELYAEGAAGKGLLGDMVFENIRSLVSSLNSLDPEYRSTYKPTIKEMNGEDLTAEEFTERVKRNSILQLPSKILCLENEFSKIIK